MGIFDGWRYGQKVEMRNFRKMLAEKGLDIRDVHIPNLLNMEGKTLDSRNPYASPRTVGVPSNEVYEYVRIKGDDKVEYFAQHIAHHKIDGQWKPGELVHAPIKLPSKKKSKN